ncbi:hypothetical protein [Paenibacillus sp. SN-8-1]|uniref:hypothetical protein n=1 Tax=Paenibacillus sp. SN-8-1 TaxID=3435409 RepID=UPI003D9A0F75
MGSRLDARKQYASEIIDRLKRYNSMSGLSEAAWKIMKEELEFAFSAGVDYSANKFAKEETRNAKS